VLTIRHGDDVAPPINPKRGRSGRGRLSPGGVALAPVGADLVNCYPRRFILGQPRARIHIVKKRLE
jgi:hypothetical protein